MHELSLCAGVLRTLQENALNHGFSHVRRIWLEIGELAGIEIEAMKFSFDVVSRHSLAENAKLEIINIPGEAWCMQCAKKIHVKQRFDCCPDCKSYQLQVTGGEELKIKEVEVE